MVKEQMNVLCQNATNELKLVQTELPELPNQKSQNLTVFDS